MIASGHQTLHHQLSSLQRSLQSKDYAGFVTSGTVFLADAQYLVALMTMHAFIVLMTLPSMTKLTKVSTALQVRMPSKPLMS